MPNIEQLCDTKNILIVPGDTLSFSVTFPFDISTYTIEAGTDTESFTVTPDETAPLYTVWIGITSEQSAQYAQSKPWYLRFTDVDGYQRTANKGKIIPL